MIKKFEEFANEGIGSSIRNWFYDKPKEGDIDWVEEPDEEEKEEEEEWVETKANRKNWDDQYKSGRTRSSKRKRRPLKKERIRKFFKDDGWNEDWEK